MSAPMKRVLVFLKSSLNDIPIKADFTQSLVGFFNENKAEDVAKVFVRGTKEVVILSDAGINAEEKPVKIKRAPFCPINLSTKEQKDSLPIEILERGVGTGAVALVESSDGKVLLLRRSKHLRTFPGVWVPPGGHVDMGETLEEASLRELKEETGLQITEDMLQETRLLALWESVYPPMLSMGPPRRHHAVAYIHFKLLPPYTSDLMFERLTPDPEECEASMWLARDLATEIVAAAEEQTAARAVNVSHLQPTVRALIVPRNATSYEGTVNTSVLVNRCSGDPVDIERVSTGTKFALSEWIHI